MGTDIHGRLQTRYSNTGVWLDAGKIEDDRNYCVFAMLADVRNGRGCAGAKTHDPIEPISLPRGLPQDIELRDAEQDYELVVRDHYDTDAVPRYYWLGHHSHSWLTLKEVVDWPGWGKTMHMVGYLDAAEMARVQREGGTPNSWCGMTNEPGAVLYEWDVSFGEYVPQFKAWVDYLALKYSFELAKRPDDVRLVFGFDS